MSSWSFAALAVAAIGCGGQSFADGVAALCDGPNAAQVTSAKSADRAARLATWVDAHVDNAEVRALIDGLAQAPVRRRASDLAAALKRAGLDRCAGETADQLATVGYFGADIPDVGSGAGFVPADRVPDLIVTTRDIVVGDNRVVALGSDGDVDPSEKEGGALGMQIDALRDAAGAILPEHRAGAADIALAIDRRTSYALLIEIVYSLSRAHRGPGFTYGVLATSGDAVGYLPIRLPERAPQLQDGTPARLGLIVTETPTGIRLWSVSGLEGTLAQPKVDLHGLDDLRPLQAALEEIVHRRWPDGRRDALDHQIIVMLDSAMPVQRLLELAAVVRVGSNGDELFGDIVLSMGFR